MGASETLSNEVTDTLGYLIDKFNLTLDVSSNQIKEFSEQMATKIITWELINSAIYLMISVVIIVLAIIALKHFKIKTFKECKELYDSVEDYITKEEKAVLDKCARHVMLRVVFYLIVLMALGSMFSELKDIILCIAFPEKIILDFIGQYI